MALTRKFLTALEIPAEKIEEIITAHTETISAIKEERDSYKTEADRLPAVEAKLEKANEELEAFKSGDWENKYNTLKGEYDSYKTDTESKAAKTAKENAYKQLLLDAGVSDKRIASVLKVSDIDSIKLDKDGKIEGADDLTAKIKTEWADFIVSTTTKGAEVATPPANNGGADVKTPSRASQLVAQYRAEHYGEKEA
jgi:hypothetical protein